MIIDIILKFLLTILNSVLGILPESSLPEGIATAISSLSAIAMDFNEIFPVDTLFQIGLALLALEAAIFLFKFANWTYGKVRGTT